MGTRKRQGSQQNAKQDEGTTKLNRRKRPSSSSGEVKSVTPCIAVGILLAFIVATGGIYIYYFVDVTDALDLVQSRISKLFPSTDHDTSETIKDIPTASKPEKPKPKVDKKSYTKKSITSSYDNKIRGQLDAADAYFEKRDYERSQRSYEDILARYPTSPRAHAGLAATLNELANIQQSNALLEKSIEEYQKVMDMADVPRDLKIKSGKQLAERQSFRGWAKKAVDTMLTLTTLFPDDMLLKNDLGVKYLLSNRVNDARNVFMGVLRNDPNNGFALVHYGFILKTTDNNNAGALEYLQKGIDSGHEGTSDGRFFFHLGDAYFRMGFENKSQEVFEEAARRGLFRSKWQRSLYNVDHLVGRPWWTLEQTGVGKKLQELEKHWRTIRDEGLAQMEASGVFRNEDENLREVGDWKQFTLYSRGKIHKDNCERVPKTCALLQKIPEATSCTRGQIKYSVMHPGTHVWPHTGPTNCRIRAHLGLVVPDGPRIRVTDDTRTWKEGKFIVFDDSFEHEVWHDGKSLRLVLIVDLWHPEITPHEKQTLSPI